MKAKDYHCEVISTYDSRNLSTLIAQCLDMHRDKILLNPPPLVSAPYRSQGSMSHEGTIYTQILWFKKGDPDG